MALAQGAVAAEPALHTRSSRSPDATPPATAATGHTDLPPEAEGRYRWGRGGSAFDEVEVYVEDGKLQGYMLEHMDPNPHASPTVFPFATTHADGHAIAWTTREVHGTIYSFTGHVERGLAASGRLPGYYLMTGTLTEHGGDADGLTSTVSLKREPAAP